jgi:hypothetical protein
MNTKRKTTESNYYTAGETKEILGIDNNMLYKYVRNNTLEKIFPPGSKQGVYQKSQVNQLAQELEIFISTRDEYKTGFRKAEKDDIQKCMEIGTTSHHRAQQQGITSLEARLSWLDKNPDLYYVIEQDREIVGYTSIIPLKPEKIKEILDSKNLTMDIKPEEIDEFKSGKPLHIYIATMRTKPNISKTQKRLYGVKLVSGLISTIVDMLESGIDIQTLYGDSETVDGIRMLKHMGFMEIPSITESKNYILELDKEYGKSAIEKYKRIAHRTAAY